MKDSTPYGGTLKARPTLYKGIRMRSRLEAQYAAMFDEDGTEWEYEPECFADETGQYLPDFRLKPGGRTYIEIKGIVSDPLRVMAQMEIILSSEPDAYMELREGPPGGEGRHWIGYRNGDQFQWVDLNEWPDYCRTVLRSISLAS